MIHLHGTQKGKPLQFIAYATNDDVYSLLNRQLKGTVHSIFNHSFNLIFNGKLIHIGSLENGLAPFGIGMSPIDATHLTQQIKPGQQVIWDKACQKVIFNDRITLSLKQLTLVNHVLHCTTYDQNILQKNTHLISHVLLNEKWHTGLVETNHAKKQLIQFIMNPNEVKQHDTNLLACEKLGLLVKGEQLTNDEIESIFNYWIGRGPGLTPSGDDMMVGICAVLSLFCREKSRLLPSLKDYLHVHGEKRTTQVSLEYLLYAVDYKYHSHIVNLSHLLLTQEESALIEALDEVGKLGHTSGTDTLIGILLGLQMVTYHS